MMHIAGGARSNSTARSSAARVSRPLPGSMVTGRATMAGFKRPEAPRAAMNDRTNLTGRPGAQAAKNEGEGGEEENLLNEEESKNSRFRVKCLLDLGH